MNISLRKDAIEKAKQFINQEPVYVDTETTGTGPNDTIIEIAVIDSNSKVLIDTLVKPVGKIQPDAFRVHGITDKIVADAPRWIDVWQQVEAVLSNKAVGIYNAEFDLRMMKQSHTSSWMKWEYPPGMEPFCIMKLYAQFHGDRDTRWGGFRWQSLDNAQKQCGIPLMNTHRAKDDTYLAKAVMEYIANHTD
jgi:DNA polymerase-3 subunit epsilon